MRTPDQWSLGVYIGLPVMGLIVIAAIVSIVLAVKFGDEDRTVFVSCGVIVLIFALIVGIVAYYPFSSEFHRWYKVNGPVDAIGSRQIAHDNAMSVRYVFRIDGEEYGVDDTRASLIKVGDTVTLKCKREYVYNSASGWACNWAN